MLSRLMSIPHDCNSFINVSLVSDLVADRAVDRVSRVSTVNTKEEEFIRSIDS
jgi:hypothetical protein